MAGYEGGEISLECIRFLDGEKAKTYWKTSQHSYDGHPSNKLNISNLNASHDGMEVYCGSEDQPNMNNFTLKIYRMQTP